VQKLKDSELRYRRLFEAAQDGILILDAETGMINDVNPFLIKMLGYSREEFVEKRLWEVGAFQNIKASQEAFEALQKNEYIRYEDLPLKTKAGKLIQVEFVSNVYSAGGEKVIQCNIRDITEHKRIIAALQENEKKYHGLVNQSPDGIFIVGSSGNILIVNKAMCRELEFSEEELLSMNIWDIIPEQYLDQYRERLAKILAGESLKEAAEYKVRGKDGKIHYIEVLSAPHYSGKDIVGFQGIARDITARKRAEKALRESERRFQLASWATKDVVWERDFPANTISWNDSLQKLFHYPADEIEPTVDWWQEHIHPAERIEVINSIQTAIDQREDFWSKEYRFRLVDGSYADVFDRGYILYNEQGKPLQIIGAMADITDQKRAEEALRESEERFRTMFVQAPLGIALIDSLTGNIYEANPRFAEITGRSMKEMANIDWMQTTHPDDVQADLDNMALLNAGKINGFQMEKRYLHPNGTAVWINMTIAPLKVKDKAHPRHLCMIENITERKQAETEIRQRLSELEVLYQSGLAFSQLINPTAIAEKIIDLLDHEMDWHHTAVRLYHPESETLKLMAFHLPDLNSREDRDAAEERLKSMARTDQGFNGWVLQHGQAVRSNDLKNDPRYFETFPGLQSGLYTPMKINERTIGVISIESERASAFSESNERLAFTLAGQAAIAIENARLFENAQRSNSELMLAYETTLEGWSRALDLRDKETEGHTQRVTKMTVKLARSFGLNEAELVDVRRGALLHDIGKMGVPDNILLKPGELTEQEWKQMRMHPVYAYDLLSHIAYLRQALNIPYYHHEKWDGTGYPRGLKGEAIPLTARIFAVVDVWDALISDRPYRAAWTKEQAREYIRTSAGTHFDPQVVAVFMQMRNWI
jgi:PAS domain S-box-containing protein